ncbi:hypothetical protein BHE74_00036009 [Ensete ventricosum]|nr:hypothetical protein BHE74_00036009 [Ensete ventricosum]RZS12786.1 hypothetical protein BHM03_00044286 [Ensete ventricosum]
MRQGAVQQRKRVATAWQRLWQRWQRTMQRQGRKKGQREKNAASPVKEFLYTYSYRSDWRGGHMWLSGRSGASTVEVVAATVARDRMQWGTATV